MNQSVNLKEFLPNTSEDFFNVIKDNVKNIAEEWWETNKEVSTGYLRSISEAAFQTQKNLQAGNISPEMADILMENHKIALNQYLRFVNFQSMVIVQKILDAVFSTIAWGVFNKTGINIFPEYTDVTKG